MSDDLEGVHTLEDLMNQAERERNALAIDVCADADMVAVFFTRLCAYGIRPAEAAKMTQTYMYSLFDPSEEECGECNL